MPSAYTMSQEQALKWIEERYRPGMTEVHIVNGLNPDLPFDYYTDLLRAIRERFPALHLKAFTAVEIHYFAEKFGMSYREVLERLIEAGLGSLPGGGAEVFAERVRQRICRDKVDADGWLDVHRTAHQLGLKSNCTILYGTIETREERIDHLMRLRDLQDETGGFQAFVPLAYHPDNNRLRKLGAPTADDDLRMIAVSRLDAGQHPAHQGLLDHARAEDGAGRAAFRRQRHGRHGDRREDLPHGRRRHAQRADDRRTAPADPRDGAGAGGEDDGVRDGGSE